jgi:hypothetical protein
MSLKISDIRLVFVFQIVCVTEIQRFQEEIVNKLDVIRLDALFYTKRTKALHRLLTNPLECFIVAALWCDIRLHETDQ